MANNRFQVLGLITILEALKEYVTNFGIIFGELVLFLGNGSLYQKNQIILMNDKY